MLPDFCYAVKGGREKVKRMNGERKLIVGVYR
jgi:hypothetical protein